MPTLGSATWSNYQRNLPTCRLQAKEPLSEISGTDDIFGIQEEPGDTNFLLELRGLKNAEVTESSPVQSVQGRINAHKNWWFKNFQLSALVIGVLLTSYIIPFVALPPPCFIKNNKSALDHAEFAANAINELVINRCAIEVFSRPYCCNPLSVVRGRKLRLVLDLSRSVNPFVRKFKFKYESLPTLAVMFRDNFWFFTFDIESGYHHLDINYNCWKYLGFSWSFNGVEKYFVFRVLPFGLSSACHLFTKMFKPLVAR